ncbi:MAG TPA: TonB-dependent receptor [Steroidobacter sp.]|uniref:TonB-dependent receptor n=1 Tax=Steroidobacter sp. TaxID=1978227 RepID=UPI002EDB2F39
MTAQRRAQPLQRVPVAATALDSQALQQKGVTSLLDVPKVAPSLDVTTPYGNNGPEITMRGIGGGSFNKNTESTVATYLDETVLNLSTAKLGQLFDLERVEVLRGPQGTLYGKNSTGGAINFISKRPDGATEAEGSLTAARFGTYEANLGVQAPLTDELSVRVAARRNYSDGYSFNTLTGRHLNDVDDWGGRVGLRYQNDKVDSYLKVFFDRSDTNGTAYYPQGVYRANNAPSPSLVGAPTPNGINVLTGYVPPSDIDVVAAQHSPSNIRNDGASLNTDFYIGDLTLTSVTGYIHSQADTRFDADGSPFDIVHTLHFSKGEQFTQEVRLTSSEQGAFTWIVGGAFFYQKQDGGVQVSFPGLGRTVPVLQTFEEKTTSFAGFVDGTYKLSDRFELFSGVRATTDKKEIHQIGVGNFALADYDASDSEQWTKPSYRAGVNFKPTDATLLYASYNHGYRSGAYDVGFITNPAQIADPVNPEYVDNYEVGLKTNAFDNHLRVSTAAFYMEYEDQQLAVTPPGVGSLCCSLVNAGKARVYGLEVEGAARFSENFDVNFSGTVLDTKYLEFKPDGPTGARDFAGYELGRAPEYELSLEPEFRYPLAAGEIFFAPEFQFTGKQRVQTTVDRFGEDIQPAYNLINGQLGYRDADGRYSAFLFVQNATDKRVLTYFANTGATAVNQTFYSAPRTYGVTLTGRF